MFKTNPPYDELESLLPEWHEPFPQPQTIPSGWDLSEVISASSLETMDDTEVNTKS